MTTESLIELSLFDAFGLLEPDEHEAFERALRAASPGVKAQVRAEQTRFAQTESLLPDVQPPSDLGERVLATFRRELGQDGRAAELQAARKRDNWILRFAPNTRVSPIWRASALGCAAAALVFGFTTMVVQNENASLERTFTDNAITEQAGSGLVGSFFNRDLRQVRLGAASATYPGSATLFVDRNSDTHYLLCRNLPNTKDKSYEVVLLDAAGNLIEKLATLESRGQIISQRLSFAAKAGMKLAIRAPKDKNGPDQDLLIAIL
jgi:hypothetical protein